nr:hypothetical protein [Tanacetum cinerariifolium]
MGRDGNNQMFPIAWAVVNIENIDNWEWFLACLCEDLRLNCGLYMTVISDSHKGAAASTIQHNFYSKMNLFGNIDPEAKQCLVDRNPNSWCRAFFKMDRGCAAYKNGIFKSYHNPIRIARCKPLITMLEEIRVYLMQRLYSMHNLAANLGDADPSSAGPSVGDPSSAGPSVGDPSSAVPSVADSSSAGLSVADSTGSGTQTITEDPIVADPTDDIPTQQSKTSDTAKIIEDAIATGRLKTAGLK